MARNGLLILTNPTKFGRLLPVIRQHVKNTLYVQCYPGRQRLITSSTNCDHPVAAEIPCHGQTVIGIYSQTSAACRNLDVRVLLAAVKDPSVSKIQTRNKIEVVIFDRVFNKDEVDRFLKYCIMNATKECQVVTLAGNEDLGTSCKSSYPGGGDTQFKMCENVVLGGTFDRLHAGHKILLSEAVLRCTRCLTVGVTDTPMLKSKGYNSYWAKVLWELIEPCSKRICSVQDFLQDVDPGLEYNIVPIVDAFGPTKDDPTLQMIVVSKETYKGGIKVNELRQQNKLSTLEIHIVDLLNMSDKLDEVEEDKISSSNTRLRLLGTYLKHPEPKPWLSKRPYIIGLTGNIASGKSSVSKRLAALGAGLVNADTLGHEVYKKGSECYNKIVKHFGHEIIAEDGEINRKALGAIVFGNKEQMQMLNSIVWPEILERIKQQISELHSVGHDVIVLDAAVLNQAGWDKHVHEVWSCIIPPEEAVKRLQQRNGLSESDAKARLEAQPSNTEHVMKANIILSTFWSYEYTQKQVETAWENLKASLAGNSKY